MIGLRFHKLVVIAQADIKVGRKLYWLCECDCGNKTTVSGVQLRSGKTKSCGCLRVEVCRATATGSIRNRLQPGVGGLRDLYRNYQYNAKKRKLVFSLSIEEFKEITSSNCYYCQTSPNTKSFNDGKTMTTEGKRNSIYIYNGIDRLDNLIGYIPENCVPCCAICNIAKGKMSLQEFESWVFRVSDNLKRKGY